MYSIRMRTCVEVVVICVFSLSNTSCTESSKLSVLS